MSAPNHYRQVLSDATRIVVKVGSRALLDERGDLNDARIQGLVDQIAAVRARGVEVILVSSGAVAAGRRELHLTERPDNVADLQAAAAIGQAALIGQYRAEFGRHGAPIGQVLLTHADLASRERHLNARTTFLRLLRAGAVPIVNENDTVAVDEIRFGDNDALAALVAVLVQAEGLMLLTTADGLLTEAGPGGARVPRVETIDDHIRAMVGEVRTEVGTGGMGSKLDAADVAVRAGEWAVIANAGVDDVIPRVLAAEDLGTFFDPRPGKMASRKRWIAFFDHACGDLIVDDGARHALETDGGSLLPIGLRRVMGDFKRGDPVRIVDLQGEAFARGLANYAADEARRLIGCRTDEIRTALGFVAEPEVVHRDNLVLER